MLITVKKNSYVLRSTQFFAVRPIELARNSTIFVYTRKYLNACDLFFRKTHPFQYTGRIETCFFHVARNIGAWKEKADIFEERGTYTTEKLSAKQK